LAVLISLFFLISYLLSLISLNPNRFLPSADLLLSQKVTSSSDIRRIVWVGAIELTNRYPFFGSGIETFAYAYNFTRPAVHNLTSEWDYVYNKAHNEVLNYLATTGYFGLFSYLLMWSGFIYLAISQVIKWENYQAGKLKSNLTTLQPYNPPTISFYICSLLAIFITNFFGFSTTTISLFTFTLPVIFLKLTSAQAEDQKPTPSLKLSRSWQLFYFVYSLFIIVSVFNYFSSDRNYALTKAAKEEGDLVSCYQLLNRSISLRPDPEYLDEQSLTSANISATLKIQKQLSDSDKFKNQALELNNQLIKTYPLNLDYQKTSYKINYLIYLANLENKPVAKKYFQATVDALEKAQKIAPTQVENYFNEAQILLYKDPKKAKELINQVLRLKPNYQPAKDFLQKLLEG
jgi:tetratricopeptide (TPR) repeat protein